MRNYNVYLSLIEKSLDEKLFFLKKLKLDKFSTIIDFGCAKGDILKACAPLTKAKLIGIDHDETMRSVAQSNVPNATFYSKLTRGMIKHKTLIIFSSVLHEVEDYWSTLKNIIKGTGATLVIRDMRYSMHNTRISKANMSKLIRSANQRLLADFSAKYGLFTEKDMYHFLLKYSYVDNWELELKENYFSFDYNDLFTLGDVVYQRNYVLQYKKDRVLEDFNIKLTKPTHTQIILKVRG